ncbi:S-adenosyl-L-methionine-dependent methyltransferase [Xylariaceae sp. FL0594]|nr:S-adenosyl-L-methionine-dependent methyltransferase [Xylariaceae sp. FL0594]
MSSLTGSHGAANSAADAAKDNTTTTTSLTATSASIAKKPDSHPVRDAAAQSPETYEQEHVHSVYESIAGHFSSTRYKPWPFIASFLRERVTPGSVGLDVGCGNGKYLCVRETRDVHLMGCDRSASLVAIARDNVTLASNLEAPESKEKKKEEQDKFKNDVAVADGLALPYRRGAADFALCIAVVHHLSTRERRVEALRALLECLRADGGQMLVYVWALEQKSSRRGWDAESDQDQLVPWVMKANQNKKKKQNAATADGDKDKDTTYERFYHLYREGELEEDMRAAGGRVLESGYERDNWWVIGARADG